jgi:hypothetical protein
MLQRLQSRFNGKILSGVANIDKNEAKTLANSLYDKEVSEGKLNYETLLVIASEGLRDWKFEDLPQVLASLEGCHIISPGRTDEQIQQIFSSVYTNGARPEVVDFIKSKVKNYDRHLLLPALGMIANDEAVDFLIERRGKRERIWRFDEYTKALKTAASKGSKKANEYIFKNSDSPVDIYYASRQMGRSKTRSLLSAIATVPKMSGFNLPS